MDEFTFDFKKIKLPTYAFIVYILLIPFEAIMATHIVVMVSYATITAVITSLLVLIYLLFKPKLVQLTKTAIPWVAFFIWAGLSIYWSINRPASIYDYIFISKHLFFLLLISSYPFNYSEKRVIRHAIILSGILLSAVVFFTTFQVRGITTLIRATISSGYYQADPNHIASTLLLPIAFLIVDFVERKKYSVLDLIAAIILFSTLAYTGSRGAFVSFLLLVIVLIIQYFKHARKKKAILTLVFILAGVAVSMSIINPSLLSRFAKIDKLDRYSANRVPIWQESVKLWREKPLAGYGFGTFKVLSGNMTKEYKTAHNILVQSLVEGGIVSFILLVIVIVPTVSIKGNNSFSRAAKAGVIGVFVSSMFLFTINYDYFWLAIIIAEIANRSTLVTKNKEGMGGTVKPLIKKPSPALDIS